jgi:flagellar export protein FliJ
MSNRNWLPTVLRARQAQEDLVAQRVAVARRDAGLAAVQLTEHTARVAAMSRPASMSGAQFQAQVTGQQAAAATLAAAANRLQFAEARVVTGLTELTNAARARRTVEKLHERDEELRVTTALSNAQREQDEVSISRHGALQRAGDQAVAG